MALTPEVKAELAAVPVTKPACRKAEVAALLRFAGSLHIAGGKIIVVSGFTVGLVLGLSVIDMSQNGVANLGWNNIKLTSPVYVGDTLYAESICTDKRTSKSRPDMGIISMMTRALNQHGDVVMTYDRSVMVPTRASGIGQDYFPQAKSGPMQLPAQS